MFKVEKIDLRISEKGGMMVLLKSRNRFRTLPPSIEHKTVIKSYRRDRYIFQGYETADKIYLIKEGIAKVIKISSSGKKVTVEYKKAGDFIGLETLFLPYDELYDTSLLTMTTVAVESIQRKDLEECLINTPELAIEIIRKMGIWCRGMSTQLMDYTFNDVFGKTVKAIKRLGNDYGQPTEKNGLLIDLPITNRELSNFVGSSRETVSRVMSKLKEADLISYNQKRIKVNNWRHFCLFAEKY